MRRDVCAREVHGEGEARGPRVGAKKSLSLVVGVLCMVVSGGCVWKVEKLGCAQGGTERESGMRG